MPAKANIDENVMIELYRYENKTLDEIAEELDCNRHTVMRRLKKLNIIRAYQDEEWLRREHIVEGNSIQQMAKASHCNPDTITKYMQKHGIETVLRPNKHQYNDDVFEVIDTEEKAYWLGFIVADGGIEMSKSEQRSTYRLRILLSAIDKPHLESFAKWISSTVNVKEGSTKLRGKEFPYVSVSIYSKKIVEDLHALGVETNKAAKEVYIESRDDLDRHFIRGNFDGDGCFSHWRSNGTLYQELSFLGSKQLMETINAKLMRNLNVSGAISEDGVLHKLRITRIEDVVKVMLWMYIDSNVKLERKHKKYLEWLTLRDDVLYV